MSYYGARIGKYMLSVHDSELYFKHHTTKDKNTFKRVVKAELDTYANGAALSHGSEDSKEIIEYPITMFGKVIKRNNRYSFEQVRDVNDLMIEMLFSELQKRNIPIELTFYLDTYVYDESRRIRYYLISTPLNVNVTLTNVKMDFIVVRSVDYLRWAKKHNLRYE